MRPSAHSSASLHCVQSNTTESPRSGPPPRETMLASEAEATGEPTWGQRLGFLLTPEQRIGTDWD